MSDQYPVERVQVDLDGSGLADARVTSWSVESQIATDVPEQIQAAPGVAAAEARIEITDAPVTFAHEGSPFRKRTRRTWRPVQIEAGTAGDADTLLFTGRTTSAPGQASGSGISLEAVDELVTLQGNVTLPAWYEPGMTALGPLDAMLRQAGYYSAPPMTPGAALSVPFQGWCAPEHSACPSGWSLAPSSWDTHGGLTVWTGGGTPWWEIDLPLAERRIGLTYATAFEVVFYAAGLSGLVEIGIIGDLWGVYLDITGTQIKVFGGSAHGSLDEKTLSYTPGWVKVTILGQSWAGGSPDPASFVTVEQPGGSPAMQTLSASLNVLALGDPHTVSVYNAAPSYDPPSGVGLACLQVGDYGTFDGPAMTALSTHTSQTDLDPSLNVLQGTPTDLTGSVKDEITRLVEAEFGAFWFAPGGIPTFRNADSLRGIGATPVQVTSTTNLHDFSWVEDVENIRSAVEVVASPVARKHTGSQDVVAFTAESALHIPAGQVTRVTLDLDVAPIILDTTITALGNGAAPATGSWFRQNSLEDGSGAYTPVASASVRQVGPAKVEVTFTGGAYDVWCVDTSGDPAFVLRAFGTLSQPEEQQVTCRVDNLDQLDVGENVLRLDANPWRQDHQTAQMLAGWLSGWTTRPLPTVTSVDIKPNLAVTRGSVVEISDPEITGAHLKALVVGCTVAVDESGEMTQTLDVRPLAWTVDEWQAVADVEWATVADFDAYWSGTTVADFDAYPLGRL